MLLMNDMIFFPGALFCAMGSVWQDGHRFMVWSAPQSAPSPFVPSTQYLLLACTPPHGTSCLVPSLLGGLQACRSSWASEISLGSSSLPHPSLWAALLLSSSSFPACSPLHALLQEQMGLISACRPCALREARAWSTSAPTPRDSLRLLPSPELHTRTPHSPLHAGGSEAGLPLG